MPAIGLISDTHNYLDPEVKRIFAGVDHIFHAGDIGRPRIILELETVAPVTAVLGNMDVGLPYPETELRELFGLWFLLHHVVNPDHPDGAWRERIEGRPVDVVVSGHTHRPFCGRAGSMLFVNPGSASRPRHAQAPTVAILHLLGGEMDVRFHELRG